MLLLAGARRKSRGLVLGAVLLVGAQAAQAAPKSAKTSTKTKAGAKEEPAPPAPAPTPDPTPAPPPKEPEHVTAPPPVAKPAPAGTHLKVAVLPLECGPGVKKELAEIIGDALASALATHTELDVTTARDVAARLGYERQRELLGGGSACADNLNCMLEIGNALGADLISFGSIARIGESAVLNTTVITLRDGGSVRRHTERVKAVSEEAFLDAIAPSVAALFPSEPTGVVQDGSSSPVSDTDGARVSVTVRGQMAPLNLPLGAWVVHAAYHFNESLSAGLGAIIARPFGVMARVTWVPFNAHGRVRPLVALEVPMLFSAAGPAVGVGGAVGLEVRLLKQLAVGAEMPVSYYFGGPTDAQRFWLFGAVTLSGRL